VAQFAAIQGLCRTFLPILAQELMVQEVKIQELQPDAAPAMPPPPKILHGRAAAGELLAPRRDQLKFAV
jgi:hypothetical protein